jgi:hypothetical protein
MPTPPAAPSTSTVCPGFKRARTASATCEVPNATGRPAPQQSSCDCCARNWLRFQQVPLVECQEHVQEGKACLLPS